MAMSVKASGTQAATLTTEHTLLDTADLGVYSLTVNLANLSNGETVELLISTKVASGGGYLTAFRQVYQHAQGLQLAQSFHVAAPYGAKFTLKQTGGTGRSFGWFVSRLDG